MRDLLFAQKVCTRFKNVIDSSTPIQRALYFEAVSVTRAGDTRSPAINPLLSFVAKGTAAPVVFGKNGKDNYPFTVSVLELSYTNDAGIYLDSVASRVSLRRLSDSFRCTPRGSWRRMFATQPPCGLQVVGYDYGRVIKMPARRLGEVFSPESYSDEPTFVAGSYMRNSKLEVEGPLLNERNAGTADEAAVVR